MAPFSDAGVSIIVSLRKLFVTSMCWKNCLLILVFVIPLPGHAQTVGQPDEAPILAFKLLIRSTQSTFSPGEPLKLEVACVSVPTIAPPKWQQLWNEACSNVKLKTEEARVGGYWGGVGLIAWLQNRLHLCLLPPGESYRQEFHVEYTKPQWRATTIPAEKLAGLRGMVQINAQVALGSDLEFAQAVTAIISSAKDDDSEAALEGNIQIDAAAVQSGDKDRSHKLANELLETSNGGALRMAVRLFDNTSRTADLWTFIENSPRQQEAVDLMEARLKDADLVPDYDLLVKLTGMKARLNEPLEFDAEDRQPYTEYHPDLEQAALAYFQSLLHALVASSGDPRSARAMAIREIVESLAESEMCPLGTYGLTSTEAAVMENKLSEK